MAHLVWRDPEGDRLAHALGDDAVLGRDAVADCTLEYRGVSRRHARILRREGAWWVEDLGSTNGTLLNGARLDHRERLRPGDRIRLGKVTLEFHEEDRSAGRHDPGEQDAGLGAERDAGSGGGDRAGGELTDPAAGGRVPGNHAADEDEHRSPEPGGPAPAKGSATEPLSRTLKYERLVASGQRLLGSQLPEVLPRRFGKFRLEEKLGQGGMGAVYRARDLETEREVAVKLIRSHIGRREAFLDFFHNREAVLAREIDHPNVVRVQEHGVENDQHYISMEHVRGENLYRAMKRRRFEPAEVLEVLRQTACGLAAAHRQGVVHSDIKPANIVLVDGFREAVLQEPEVGDASEGEIEDADGILEFQGDTGTLAARAESTDPGLEDEARRRLGQPSSLQSLDDPPYYPRASEMRFLSHYLERLEEGRGFFLLVEGEAGVGKKRLLSEFFLQRRREGESPFRFLELDASRIEGIPALYESIVDRKPGADFNLRQTVDEIVQLLEDRPAPTVLRVLDLGQAFPLACYLLHCCARLMESQPLLVVANIDPEDTRRNASVHTLLDSVENVLKQLWLRPLTEYQVQRYVDLLFPDTPAGPALALHLYRLSGGNFSRLFELLRSFMERGILRFDAGNGKIEYRPSQREFELEEGRNLYEKYRAYGRPEQRTLQQAAFLGDRFHFEALLRFASVDETALFFAVRQLLADGFLVEDSRTWYRFTNEAFRRYMEDRTPSSDRPHLHRKVTRILQTSAIPECAELFWLLGRHFAGCREHGRAVQAYLEGAHLARNDYETGLARAMYQEILRIYRELAGQEKPRREVTAVLREWFRRDANWYEVLGELGARAERALVKIADFGISFRAADEERGWQVGRRPVMGTPRYVAPERSKGEPGGAQSDIFSLGIIAYEMVTGHPPFPALRRRKLARAYQTKPVRLRRDQAKDYPEGFVELVHGMVSIDPARRWDAERVVREVVKLQFDLRRHGRSPSAHD